MSMDNTELTEVGDTPVLDPAKKDMFHSLVPTAQIEAVNRRQIPQNILEWFEGRSSLLILPRDYRPGNFTAYYTVSHEGGNKTFLARQTKTIDGAPTEYTYFFDGTPDGALTSHGEISKLPDSDEPPFVHFIGTDGEKREGVATRLLAIMNGFSKIHYGAPLDSGGWMTDDGRKFFEGLVEKGVVAKYTQDGRDRYKVL